MCAGFFCKKDLKLKMGSETHMILFDFHDDNL